MKKILLSMTCLILVGIQHVTAQSGITAPIQPVELELQDETECYLYNVGTELFWDNTHTNNNGSYMHVSQYGAKFTITKQSDDTYTLYRQSDTQYMNCSSGSIGRTTSSTSTSRKFRLTKSDRGYTIQRNESYVENQYVGASNGAVIGNYSVTDEMLPNDAVWKLLPPTEETEHYMAKLHLYHVLLNTETYKGLNFDKFTTIYNNESSTTEELKATANKLDKALSLTTFFAETNASGDYPMLFENDETTDWERDGSGKDVYVRTYLNAGETRTLTATVVVDQDVTLRYEPYNSNSYEGRGGWWYQYDNNYYWSGSGTETFCIVEVYVDDVLVRTIDHNSLGRDGWRYFEELTPGKHVIKWVCKNPSDQNRQYIDIQYPTVYATPLVEVNLAQAGSLGTEVLYNVDNIANVRNLKISGPMNADDFARIDMMTMLFALDLRDAEVTAIADNEFNHDTNNGGKASKQWLHKIALPKTLKSIGINAFRWSYIDELNFMETQLETIGEAAFHATHLQKAILPETVTTIGNHAFSHNHSLKEASMPNTVTSLGTCVYYCCTQLEKANISTALSHIPDLSFHACEKLTDMPVHDGIKSIGTGSFELTYAYKPLLPSSIVSFGERCFIHSALDTLQLCEGVSVGKAAFGYCGIRHLDVPENASLGNLCFAHNKQMVSVSLPTTYYDAYNDSPILRYNDALKEIILKSPTMLTGTYKDRMLWDCGSDFVIKVPQYLVNIYKQDSYWYNYNIQGFNTADVDRWIIRNPLTLTARDRFEGSPNLEIWGGGSLEIYGESAMELNNVYTYKHLSWQGNDWWSMVLSNCDNIKINGTACHGVDTYGNRWYYLCLPFNFKVSDIVQAGGAKFAIRYYDGANRAANGATGSWKDLPADTIVTAGTGFIYQTSRDERTTFYAVNDGDKQNIFAAHEFAKSLQPNYAEESANKGWNLVGNPYLCYYNIHKLNFTAPITTTVDNYYSNWYEAQYYRSTTYKAYSLVDDDYAIKPLEAFFVQCPDEINTITFPLVGRQLTAEITDQNGAREFDFDNAKSERPLIDLALSNENYQDQTRVVFNKHASLQYETTCDASKFMSTDPGIPQFYSLDNDGTKYAINERPTVDGTVHLGVIIPTAGTYTISVSRNRDAGRVLLKDLTNGSVTDITNEAYTFTADGGTVDSRFLLVADDVTGIRTMTTDAQYVKDAYNLAGQKVEQPTKGLYIVNGKKVVLK